MPRSARYALLKLLAVLLIGLNGSAQAATLLSDIADPSDGRYAGTPDAADHFTTGTEPLTVTSIRILWYSLGTAPGVDQIGIYADAGGFPSDTLVGSFFTNPAPTTIGFMEYTGNVVLAANTIYWMVVDISDRSEVAFTSSGTFVADPSTGGAQMLDRSAHGNNLTAIWGDDPANLQYEIVGTAGVAAPTSVPTLSTWSLLLLATSLVAFGTVLARRRARG